MDSHRFPFITHTAYLTPLTSRILGIRTHIFHENNKMVFISNPRKYIHSVLCVHLMVKRRVFLIFLPFLGPLSNAAEFIYVLSELHAPDCVRALHSMLYTCNCLAALWRASQLARQLIWRSKSAHNNEMTVLIFACAPTFTTRVVCFIDTLACLIKS